MSKIKEFFLVLISSLLLFMMCNTKYNKALGDYVLEYIGIQSWSNGEMGLHLTVVYFGILFILSLFFVNYYLNKKGIGKRNAFFLFVLLIIVFNLGTNTYTKNLKANAEGLLAIGLEYKDSKIDYSYTNNEYKDFSVYFTLINYSSENKMFYVSIMSPGYEEKEVDTIRFYNVDGSEAMFTLGGHETREIKVLLEDYVIQGEKSFQNISVSGMIQELVLTDTDGNRVKLSEDFLGETLQ